MRRTKCSACGKAYDYDRDDFCPRCGAFNQPGGRPDRRKNGLNENIHTSSFLHEQFHGEKRARGGLGLDKRVASKEDLLKKAAFLQKEILQGKAWAKEKWNALPDQKKASFVLGVIFILFALVCLLLKA